MLQHTQPRRQYALHQHPMPCSPLLSWPRYALHIRTAPAMLHSDTLWCPHGLDKHAFDSGLQVYSKKAYPGSRILRITWEWLVPPSMLMCRRTCAVMLAPNMSEVRFSCRPCSCQVSTEGASWLMNSSGTCWEASEPLLHPAAVSTLEQYKSLGAGLA